MWDDAANITGTGVEMRYIGGILAGVAMLLAGEAGAEGLPPGVPAKLAKRLAANPDAVLAAAGDLIHGHGTNGGIDQQGILQAVALDRAAARARAAMPLLAADLDGDGGVTGAEMAVVAAAADAGYRGRLMRARDRADGNGDGVVTQAETLSFAGAEGLRRVDADDEARLLAYLSLDLDGDGRLTLAEVEEAAERAAVTDGAADNGA
jgi:hypothetical protein